MKRNNRVDAARSKAVPLAQSQPATPADSVQTVTVQTVSVQSDRVPSASVASAGVPSEGVRAAALGAAAKALPLAQQAYSKAAPLAQQAYSKAGPLAQQAYDKAGPLAQQAYDKARPLAAGAVAAAVPLAHQAYDKAGPLAHQAAGAVAPYAHAVADKVTPYTVRAAEAVTPYAQRATERLAPLVAGGAAVAHGAAERVGPLGEALVKAGPALGTARDKVTDELVPRLSTAIGAATASPLAVEAAQRGRATAAAARGELRLPEPKKGSWVKRVAVVTALAGVAVLVVRQLTGGSKDSGWQAARPSTPSTPSSAATTPSTPEPATTSDAPAVGVFGTAEADAPETDPQAGLSAHEESLLANGQAEPDQPAEGGDVDVPVSEDATLVGEEATIEPAAETGAPTEDTSPYGAGSYVGLEPPEGYVIKGNENSMKYHLPSGGGYGQTIAEVWFNSADAAEQAGFTRALG